MFFLLKLLRDLSIGGEGMYSRVRKFICLTIILLLVTGCSNTEPFDDRNIIFKDVETKTSDFEISKRIEITNQTGYDLVNLQLKLSYTTKNDDASESEESNIFDGFSLKAGESKTITIIVVLNDKNNINLENPTLDFRGEYTDFFKRIPFGVVGHLSVLVEQQ